MKKYQDIDFVLPCFNPHPGWDKNVIDNFRLLQSTFKDRNLHLHIVDDGSTGIVDPGATERIREAIPGVNLTGYGKNRGKGYAVRYGVRQCTSNLILYTDHDFPYTDKSMCRALAALDKGADIVVAVRSGAYQRNLPPVRRLLSKASHLLNRMVLGMRVKDTQGGLKGFNRKGKEIFLSTRTDGFLFDTEFVLKAVRRKNIDLRQVDAEIKKGLRVSEMGIKVMRKELCNFLKIAFVK